ncbi:MAG: hypothetical protein O3C13_04395 [Bacteroidetes bacterium]|jgi:hypothetical protein|nr:hypothetical protein [Bacteroidota bacterium]
MNSNYLPFHEKLQGQREQLELNLFQLKNENSNPAHRCEVNWSEDVLHCVHSPFEQSETHSCVVSLE